MSNIDLVLLGLIKQKSQSAYDIKKNIEYRNIPRWVKISEQSIYKKVLQLEMYDNLADLNEEQNRLEEAMTIHRIMGTSSSGGTARQ
jgi:DNA-binding PadR family transcriptional regulator